VSIAGHISSISSRWTAFSESSSGKRIVATLRYLVLAAILAFLVYEVMLVGWKDVLENPPTTPIYYILFLLLYFLLPTAELLIYRLLFDFPLMKSYPAFIKKRVLNREVLGYSGEVFFFSWARRHFETDDAHLAETIRDNNIISSAASTLVAVILLGIFLSLGQVSITEIIGDNVGYYAVAAAIVLGILTPVAIRFRRYIFSMPLKSTAMIFGVQVFRLVVGQSLQIGMWAVVIPEVSIGTWFSYAAISIALTRIPFLPNHALIFAGTGIALSTKLGVPQAPWASMLLVGTALDKILNVSLFGLITAYDSAHKRKTDESDEETGTDPGAGDSDRPVGIARPDGDGSGSRSRSGG
jgi:hypothetical protein